MGTQEVIVAKEVETSTKEGISRLKKGQLKQAIYQFRQAHKNALLLGHDGYMQRACAFNLGAVLVTSKNFSEGLTYLNQATPPVGHKDGHSNGDLYFHLAVAYEGLENRAESISFFEKALGEYSSEEIDEVQVDIYERIWKLFKRTGNLKKTESYLRYLSDAYQKRGEKDKLLLIQTEQIKVSMELQQTEDVQVRADECYVAADEASPNVAGSVMTNLGLAYAMLKNIEKAQECTERAIAIYSTQPPDPKINAVLHQNMGAIFNHTGEFERSIYHLERAASLFAKANNRKCQGHCFLNLGFAYSQLNKFEKAKENFLHSNLAAKDSGDRKTEWQSLESLGAVACNQKANVESQEYYQKALAAFEQSPQSGEVTTRKRIMEKLTHIMKLLLQKPQPAINQSNYTAKIQPDSATNTLQREGTMSSTSKHKIEGRVYALRRGGSTRFIKMRRSGTLRLFGEVAKGLDPNFSLREEAKTEGVYKLMKPEEVEELSSGDEMSVDSDIEETVEDRRNSVLELTEGNLKKYIKLQTSGKLRKFLDKKGHEEKIYEVLESEGELDVQDGCVSDESKDDDDVDEEFDKKRRKRPRDSYILTSQGHPGDFPSDEESDDEESDNEESDNEDSDDDLEEKRQLKEALRKQIAGDNAEEQPRKMEVAADIHFQDKFETSEESSSESDSDSDDEGTSGKKLSKPPPPTQSPLPTAQQVGTYEAEQLVYETIDHKPPSGRSQEEKKQVTIDTNTTVYESIRPKTKEGQGDAAAKGSDKGDSSTESDTSTEQLSRAERDKIHFDSFRSSREKEKEQHKDDGKSGKYSTDSSKKSKICLVM